MILNMSFTEQLVQTNMKPKSKKAISDEIENVRIHSEGYIDAILHICEKYQYDVDDVADALSPIIKKKLEVECVNKGLVDGIQVNSLEDLM